MAEFQPSDYTEMAVKAKNALIDTGVPLNAAIAKIAEAEKLDTKQTRLVVNLANRFARNAIAKHATFVEFDVADPEAVDKIVAAGRVARVLEKKAEMPSQGFNMQPTGPVQVNPPDPEWGAPMPAQDFTTLTQKIQEAKVKLAMSLQNLDAQIDGLLKMASCEITQGEMLMAAAVVDGMDAPFCTHYCHKKLDPDACSDVAKYAGMEVDENDELVKAFVLLKEASHEYVTLLPELEKEAILGGIAKFLMKNPMGKLGALLFGSALLGGAKSGTSMAKKGMSVGAGVPGEITSMRSKLGMPALTPMGV